MATKAELSAVAAERRAQAKAIKEESPEITALTTVTAQAEGVMSIALLSDEDFEQHLELLQTVSRRIQTAMRSYMTVDEDYGTIPGTPKPTLLKPGAEKLLQLFGLAAETETRLTMGNNESAPSVTYDAITYIHRGSFAGPVVATGHGTANSWEKRYRRDTKVCPNCEAPKIIKSKYDPGFYCLNCKSKFGKDDPAITDQATSATGDPSTAFDLANTLVKMASKRSLVDATLRATASSGLFAQDLAEEAPESTAAPDTTSAPSAQQRAAAEPTVRVQRDAPPARLPQDAPGITADTDEAASYPDTVTMDQVLAATGGTEVIDIGPSTTEGVERGGRTQNANDAQIEELRRLASTLRWGAKRLLRHANEILGTDMAVPDDAAEAKAELEAWLESLSAETIGKLIAEMRSRLDADLPA